MAERKPEWPEAGDCIIATMEAVADYGAYVRLDEFNKQFCFITSPESVDKTILEGKNNWFGNYVSA